jgi:hypothetical protein
VIVVAAFDPTVIAALVAAGVALVTTLVAAPLRLQLENRLLSRRLQLEYEYEQLADRLAPPEDASRLGLGSDLAGVWGDTRTKIFASMIRLVDFDAPP